MNDKSRRPRTIVLSAISVLAIMLLALVLIFTPYAEASPDVEGATQEYNEAVAAREAAEAECAIATAAVETAEDEYALITAKAIQAQTRLDASREEAKKWANYTYRTQFAEKSFDSLLSSESLSDFFRNMDYLDYVENAAEKSFESCEITESEVTALNNDGEKILASLKELRVSAEEAAAKARETEQEAADHLSSELDTQGKLLFEQQLVDSWSAGSISVTGKLTAKELYMLLRHEGLSVNGACAVLGNMRGESGLRPTAEGGGSYGLCQWLGGRRAALMSFLEDGGYGEDSSYGQTMYMLEELRGYSGLYADLCDPNTSLEDCVYGFVAQFERPADISGCTATRTGYARAYYEEFIG